MRNLVLMAIVCVCATSCGTYGYFPDRCRDAADILTLTLGFGVGAEAKAGFYKSGVILRGDLIGLSNGEYFLAGQTFSSKDTGRDDSNGGSLHFLLFGFSKQNTKFARIRKKGIDTWWFFGFPTGAGFDTGPGSGRFPNSSITQFEASAGLGPLIRLGFNPLEVVDFLLGWFGLDLYGDDLGFPEDNEDP